MADNFDFLNTISNQQQPQIAAGQEQFEQESDNLSDILSNVNTQLKETRKKKRDSDLFFTKQGNDLAQKSDAVTQKAMQAAADPFNELKALFTDTPSMREWAARHNAVQNEMNTVKRRFAQGAAEFNFEVTEIQQALAVASQKRQLTQENIAQAGKSAQVLTTQIGAQNQIIKQQLDTMLLPDLQAELENPEGRLPKFLVQQRISLLQSAMADVANKRSQKGKSALELEKFWADFVKEHADVIPEELVAESLVSNQTVIWPQTGARITPQTAKLILPLQQQAAQERQKILTEITTNNISASISMQNMAGALQRVAGPGVSIIARNDQGEPAGFNFEAVPPEAREDVAAITELGQTISSFDFMVTNSQPSEAIEAMALTTNGLRHALKGQITTLLDKLVASETAGMKNEQAVAATDQYVRNAGRIKQTEGATQLLMEEMATVIPGTLDSGVHGKGWAAGANVFATRYQEDLNDLAGRSPELFEGEMTEAKMFALALGQKARFDSSLAAQSALNTTRQDGTNEIRFQVLNDWYETATVHGLRKVMADHVNEPETVKALQTLLIGDVALSPSITQADQGNLALFSQLVRLELDLKAKGALPAEANLARELQTTLMNDKFYTDPTIQSLTRTNTKVAAGLSRMVFNNQPRVAFVNGMQQNISSIPLDQLPQLVQAAKQRAQAGSQNIQGSATRAIFDPVPGSAGRELGRSAVGTGLGIGQSVRGGFNQVVDDFVGHMARAFLNSPPPEEQ